MLRVSLLQLRLDVKEQVAIKHFIVFGSRVERAPSSWHPGAGQAGGSVITVLCLHCAIYSCFVAATIQYLKIVERNIVICKRYFICRGSLKVNIKHTYSCSHGYLVRNSPVIRGAVGVPCNCKLPRMKPELLRIWFIAMPCMLARLKAFIARAILKLLPANRLQV